MVGVKLCVKGKLWQQTCVNKDYQCMRSVSGDLIGTCNRLRNAVLDGGVLDGYESYKDQGELFCQKYNLAEDVESSSDFATNTDKYIEAVLNREDFYPNFTQLIKDLHYGDDVKGSVSGADSMHNRVYNNAFSYGIKLLPFDRFMNYKQSIIESISPKDIAVNVFSQLANYLIIENEEVRDIFRASFPYFYCPKQLKILHDNDRDGFFMTVGLLSEVKDGYSK